MPRRFPVPDELPEPVTSFSNGGFAKVAEIHGEVDTTVIDFIQARGELNLLVEDPEAKAIDDRAMLEIDKLRPAFTGDVVSPLLHYLVSNTIDTARSNGILEYVSQQRDELTKLGGQYDPLGFQASLDSDSLVGFLKKPYLEFSNAGLARVSQTFTPVQAAMLNRFYFFGRSMDVDYFMLVASDTVFDTTQELEHRHPELGLRNSQNMTAFLRSEFAPAIFRGIASGANGFPDSLRGLNTDSAGKPWRQESGKEFVVRNGAGGLRISSDLLQAARTHRAKTAQLTRADWPTTGLQDIASRYSGGCPIRKLSFSGANPSLVEVNSNLTPEQLLLLTKSNLPTATLDSNGDGRILRDGLREVCLLVADMIDVVCS